MKHAATSSTPSATLPTVFRDQPPLETLFPRLCRRAHRFWCFDKVNWNMHRLHLRKDFFFLSCNHAIAVRLSDL